MTELAIDTIEPEDRARTGPWTCFFCGETFYTVHEASDHFGRDLLSLAACEIKASEGGLIRAIREAEEDNRRHCAEDTDLHRQIHGMAADHAQALRREEEKGYARGITDMRKELVVKIAEEARRYASHYPQSADGRNTFIMFAEWVDSLQTPPFT